MSADENGTEFIENSGILEMADANNIVALFPQVKLKNHFFREINNFQFLPR